MLIPAPLAAYLPGIAALQVSDELPPCELQLAWRTAPGENAGAVGDFVTCATSALSSGPPGRRGILAQPFVVCPERPDLYHQRGTYPNQDRRS